MGLFSELCPEQQPGQQCAQPSLVALGPCARLGWTLSGCSWPRAGQKEELCCVPELLSVEVCAVQGASSRQSLSPTCAAGWREGKKRHAIVMAAVKAERQRRQTRAYEKQTGQDQRRFLQRAKLLMV